MVHAKSVLRRHGDFWTLVFDGRVCRVRHGLGLTYLAYLVERPRCDVLALHLSAAACGTALPSCVPEFRRAVGDAGPVIDAPAVAAYRGRLRELRADLEQWVVQHDALRAEAIRAEIESLEHEIVRGVGLHGLRTLGSPVERARVRVTKSIRSTIRRLDQLHPPVAAHLNATIRTGTWCVYLPDPRVPLRWIV